MKIEKIAVIGSAVLGLMLSLSYIPSSANATYIVNLESCSKSSDCVAIEGGCEAWRAVNQSKLDLFQLQTEAQQSAASEQTRSKKGCSKPPASSKPKVSCQNYKCTLEDK